MPNDRFVPDFHLVIDGEPIPKNLRGSITSITHTTGIEGSDRVEISLINQGLRWLDHSLLALDKNVTLSLGYAPDPLNQIFVGQIVGHTASFPSSGMPTLNIAAQDRLEQLQRGKKLRWFAIPIPSTDNYPLPDPAVVTVPSVESGLIPVVEQVGAAISVLLQNTEALQSTQAREGMQKNVRLQSSESDFDFLKRISAENGWEMFIDHSGVLGGYQLRFMSPLDHLAPDVTLKYGQSLNDFTPRVSTVGQIASVTAYVWVAELKTYFTVKLAWDWDRKALEISIQPEMVPTNDDPTDYLIKEPVTAVSAPRKLVSELIPKLNRRLTGSGSTVGNPKIIAGSVLRLEGLGEQFGGLYRVTSATHTLDSGGYRTSFEVRKEIWFESIPLPEQGAVPVRVVAPFAG